MGSDALRPRVAQLEHIALATNDVEGLRDFYRCSEGWLRRLASTPNPVFRAASWISAACAWSCSSGRDDGEGAEVDGQSSGLVHLSFALGSADAVDELSGVIAAAGYRVLEPPQRTCEPAAMKASSSTPTETG